MKRPTSTSLFVLIIIAVITVIALASFFSLFEVYRAPKRATASNEAQTNLYLAIDRWFRAEGHPVRVVETGSVKSLAAAHIRTAQLYSASFNWENSSRLRELIENGMKIVIFIDNMGNSELDEFLKDVGLEYHIFSDDYDDENYDDEEPASGEEDAANDAGGQQAGVRDVDWDDVFFITVSDPSAWHLTVDGQNQARLAGRALGRGELWVSGIPYFMHWRNLLETEGSWITTAAAEQKKQELARENAAYSWKLGAGLDNEKNGILIVRNAESSLNKSHEEVSIGFWEKFFEHKRGFVLALSVAVLLVIGLWMTLPSFGVLKPDRSLPGIPIRERFTVEALFFKEHRCLHVYLEPYAAALRALFRTRGIDDDHIEQYLMEKYAIDRLAAAMLVTPAPFRKVRELVRYRALAKKILQEERRQNAAQI